MIINKIDKIAIYKDLIPNFKEIETFLNSDFTSLDLGKHEISPNLQVVKINYKYKKESDHFSLLEAHKNFMDIHITIFGEDSIVYKNTENCEHVHTPYNKDDDYILYKDTYDGQVELPKSYFCVIDPTIAHMALMGEEDIIKMVIKTKIISSTLT